MTSIGILQIGIYFLILLAITKPVGLYMARVFNGERTFLHPVLRWLEVLIYRLSGVREDAEQRWTQYSGALLSFSVFGFLLAYVIQRAQAYLPLNPQNFGTPVMTPDLAFNTAVSFLTNTNWQSYSGESTLSYFVQMAALTVQNFVSGASGVAIAIAIARGFARQQMKTIGNFWVDLTRATLYVLLPLSLVGALFLCSQGVIQNLHPNTKAATVEGAAQILTHWRWIFRGQPRASVRESDPALQLRSDADDLCDPGRIDVHLLQDGRRYSPRLGFVRRCECDVPGWSLCLLSSRARRQPAARQTGYPDHR